MASDATALAKGKCQLRSERGINRWNTDSSCSMCQARVPELYSLSRLRPFSDLELKLSLAFLERCQCDTMNRMTHSAALVVRMCVTWRGRLT